ncbi:MAG: glycoside hydrolase family 71/99-like protein [Rikenellaceae bacterium]
MKTKYILIAAILLIISQTLSAATRHASQSQFMSYKGLVMAGYQGWFNAEGDGGDRGWNHYRKGNKFEPGACTIDAWPDVSEYEVTYKTKFKNADGSPAYTFSSYDKSTVDLHFSWMKEYGLDGVFMQRFVQTIKSDVGLKHSNVVLNNALEAAEREDRTLSIMYDLSGMHPQDVDKVIEDWKMMVDDMKLTSRKENNYLYHNGKPLVAIWGVGFDNRKYGYAEFDRLIDFFKNDKDYGGCSILLGVPTFWRELGRDTDGDERLHEVIKQADIVHPWFVGRYTQKTFKEFSPLIEADIEWCRSNDLDYVPVLFPGFTWNNMNPEDEFDANPRNGGKFFWLQIATAVEMGAEMIYFAMFDEVDEGTAIFKVSNTPPVGESRFIDNDGLPSDWYLRLAGKAGELIRGEIKPSKSLPIK